MEALRAADKSRREWIAHLSHDLRTPLTTLQAHIEMVLRRDGSASASERREGLARALLHCQQIQHLLGELFESARLEAPSLELRNECFALGELAQDAALGMSDAAERLGIRLECAIGGGDSTINADIGLFHRLIDNLLTNAVKAARRGTAVVLGVHRVSDTVILTLSDTGDGPTANMLRVFNDRQEPPIGAAGFGLRIIGQILRLHGLTSRATVGPEGGTIIRIEIPAALEEGAARPVLRR
jgi:signal transduction histidine kinase